MKRTGLYGKRHEIVQARVRFLLSRTDLWAFWPLEAFVEANTHLMWRPDVQAMMTACRRALKAAGLYSPTTNPCDINVERLVRKARSVLAN